MKFLSLEPFVPSGSNFEGSKQLFQELGFKVNWDAGGYVGFQRDDCKFILQKFKNRSRIAPVISIEAYQETFIMDEFIESNITSKELLKLVISLPPAYKAVFNLFVFEGYKHREIAEILGISEGTSKSNLADARAFLQKQMIQKHAIAK